VPYNANQLTRKQQIAMMQKDVEQAKARQATMLAAMTPEQRAELIEEQRKVFAEADQELWSGDEPVEHCSDCGAEVIGAHGHCGAPYTDPDIENGRATL
jgi:hypothetical protein